MGSEENEVVILKSIVLGSSSELCLSAGTKKSATHGHFIQTATTSNRSFTIVDFE
jgi:hypothetical protein